MRIRLTISLPCLVALLLPALASTAFAHGAEYRPTEKWSVTEIKRRLAADQHVPPPPLEAPRTGPPVPPTAGGDASPKPRDRADWPTWWARHRGDLLPVETGKDGPSEADGKRIADALERAAGKETLPVPVRDAARAAIAAHRAKRSTEHPSATPEALAAHCAKLFDGTADERAAAALALGRIGGAARFPEAVRRECSRALFDAYFLASSEVTERWYAALGLGLLGRESPEGVLVLDALHADVANRGGSIEDREAAALALGLTGDRSERTRKALAAILRDDLERSRIRGRAALALALLGEEAAGEWAAATLSDTDDPEIARDAAWTLSLRAASGVTAAIDRLIEVLGPESKESTYPTTTRAAAATALGRIR